MRYDFEHQILIGTILGGSSLVKPPKGKNYYLSMRSKEENWLIYKMAQMPTLFKIPATHRYGNTFRCNSICTDILTELRSDLYLGDQRNISMNVLDSLHDIAITIWFLDGGSKTGRARKNAYINTTKFGKDGTDIIEKYFNEVGMECNVNRDGKRLKILFSIPGTETLFKVIAHLFPTFMYHRL
jgi:hypothetical protein